MSFYFVLKKKLCKIWIKKRDEIRRKANMALDTSMHYYQEESMKSELAWQCYFKGVNSRERRGWSRLYTR